MIQLIIPPIIPPITDTIKPITTDEFISNPLLLPIIDIRQMQTKYNPPSIIPHKYLFLFAFFPILNPPNKLDKKYVNVVLKVDKIGDQAGILSGTTKITRDPVGLKIASLTNFIIILFFLIPFPEPIKILQLFLQFASKDIS